MSIYTFKRLVRLPGTSHHVAAGAACGVAVSITPFIGFHLILTILLAYAIRGSIVAAVIGTIVGNPWTLPFISLLTYKLGQLMLGAEDSAAWPAVLKFHDLVVDGAGLIAPVLRGEVSTDVLQRFFFDLYALVWPMAVGSVPLGLAAGVLTYWSMAKLIHVYQAARARRREERASSRDGLAEDRR